MAHEWLDDTFPFSAASAIPQWVPVTLTGDKDESVRTTASLNEYSIGFSIATVVSPGDSAAVVTSGKSKAICGASLGAGCFLAVGSVNGVLIPVAASGVASGAPALAVPRYRVGVSIQSAAVGDVFTFLLDPDQIV
jgi:hypothetical protein